MDETTFAHETPKPAKPSYFLIEKRRILFIYIPVLLIATLSFSMFFDERSSVAVAVNLISVLGLNIFEFAWCRIDSRERCYKLHRFFSYGVVIFGFLAVIYHLFRSRGFRGGLVAVAWMLLYTILLVLAAIVVSSIIVIILILIGVASPTI